MAVKIAPDARRQFINASGVPYSGAKLFYYAAGSTTKQNTYTTSVGNVANSNPIVLDSAGRTPYGVWFTAGLSYKEVLAPSTDTDPPGSPIYTEDNISGVNDTSVTVSQWVASSLTPTYISTTSFSVPGDQTTELHVGRRLQFTVTAGTVYGRISASVYGALTTVTVVMDSGQTLDSGLTSFNWSILTATNHALPKVSGTTWDSLGLVNNDSAQIIAGNKTFSGTLEVTGATTLSSTLAVSGAATVTGTLAATNNATVGGTLGVTGVATFTAAPVGPTAAANTNNTQLATTAYVIEQNIQYSLSIPTTSGTSVEISAAIPSFVKRVTVLFDAVSTSGTSNLLIQIGDSGGYETTGYVGESLQVATTTPSITSSTSGFVINSANATNVIVGKFVLERMSVNTNWLQTHLFRGDAAKIITGAGNKYLSAALDRVRITTVGGADTFDAGTATLIYE